MRLKSLSRVLRGCPRTCLCLRHRRQNTRGSTRIIIHIQTPRSLPRRRPRTCPPSLLRSLGPCRSPCMCQWAALSVHGILIQDRARHRICRLSGIHHTLIRRRTLVPGWAPPTCLHDYVPTVSAASAGNPAMQASPLFSASQCSWIRAHCLRPWIWSTLGRSRRYRSRYRCAQHPRSPRIRRGADPRPCRARARSMPRHHPRSLRRRRLPPRATGRADKKAKVWVS